MAQYVAIRNRYRPTSLVPKPYGWGGAPSYNRGDVPSAWVDRPAGVTSEEAQQALAYEWLNSGGLQNSNYSNPPFTSGSAGRLHPLLQTEEGKPARILRGFIRRANWEAGDPVSRARLYFMYNPEAITREYVSYLDQQALDPFNTVFQSGNLVAPPSFMNFRFDLFFDRQTEATQLDHPGVYVDYQFFDLVVRNVIPLDPNQSSNQLPDNGVMMVNPRDITVVFSPQLTVQGRPINAQVTFEKFTHRMTPIRMRISLEMRVMYFGPMREMSEYRMSQAQFTTQKIVPFKEEITFKINYTDIVALQPDVPAQAGYVGSANAAESRGAMNPSGAGGDAQARGWGPHCQVVGGLSTITAAGKQITCARYISELGRRLINASSRRGYQIRTASSYNCRHVPGSAKWSNHSWGLAFDINAHENPYQTGPLVTDMPSWMPQMWNKYGFRWGGTYNTKKDAMHYEFMGTPADAIHHTKVAVAQGL